MMNLRHSTIGTHHLDSLSCEVFWQTLDSDKLIKTFLRYYEDVFDYLIVVTDSRASQQYDYGGQYIDLRNTVVGTGKRMFRTRVYGEKLKGWIHLPYFDPYSFPRTLAHEIMHTWANFIIPAGRPHWGFSSANGMLGGFDPAQLVRLGNGRYTAGRFSPVGNNVAYSPIELYLAGLIPPEEVPEIWVAKDGAWTDEDDASGNRIFTASDNETWSIQRIVEEHGARTPSWGDSQKSFRAATILIVDDLSSASGTARELSAALRSFSHPGADSDDRSYNFWEATGGRATFKTDGLRDSGWFPTNLTALAMSPSRIDLTWQDNSSNETGFMVQRRQAGSADWVEIGTTSANDTTFSDVGLSAATTYRYRVQAFNDTQSSAFSNEAWTATPAALPPTVSGFTPTGGPVGTRVTLVGTHFFEATAVGFNGVNAPQFEVVSGTRIRAVVPPAATIGPIRVVTPIGTAVSANHFVVTDGGVHNRLFVPIVLRSRGRTPGSLFTSELTLTNRGTTTTAVHYTYTASIGTGSGTAVDSLGAGEQRIIPDAIAYLTALGVPIGSGSAGGTLVVDFSNLSSPSDAAVTVRVATPVEEGRGRAGLAYMGLTSDGLLTSSAFITGLRQNSQDRSNVAVQNAGGASEGRITLRVTVFSGDPEAPGRSLVLPDRTLPPGGFYQYNGILNTAGFENGYVKVERVSGTAAYYAYGVINDNFNSDGSIVFPVREDSLAGKKGQTLPVIIETGNFTSELTVTNFSALDKQVNFSFVADAVETGGDTATFSLTLKAGQQRILPDIVEELRQQEVAGIGRANRPFVGALFATAAEGDMSGIVIGARTGSPDQRGGQYSLFYNGVPYGSATVESAWIYGLQTKRGEPQQPRPGQHR